MANVYTLGYTNQARRDLDRLERATARRIEARLRWLAENAQQIRHSPLAGRYQGYYRFRVGNYRAIYDLDRGQLVVLVIKVGHRREAYKR